MRKQISFDQLSDAVKNGINQILDDVEVKATVVVRDRDGNIKRKLTTSEVEINVDRDQFEEHAG